MTVRLDELIKQILPQTGDTPTEEQKERIYRKVFHNRKETPEDEQD